MVISGQSLHGFDCPHNTIFCSFYVDHDEKEELGMALGFRAWATGGGSYPTKWWGCHRGERVQSHLGQVEFETSVSHPSEMPSRPLDIWQSLESERERSGLEIGIWTLSTYLWHWNLNITWYLVFEAVKPDEIAKGVRVDREKKRPQNWLCDELNKSWQWGKWMSHNSN